jgi:hypothetical protein
MIPTFNPYFNAYGVKPGATMGGYFNTYGADPGLGYFF